MPAQITKLDPVAKAIWVKALRSGKYPQDKGALCTDKGYCCLGVACEVLGAEKHIEVSISSGRTLYGSTTDPNPYALRWDNLPISVALKLGIPEDKYNDGRMYVKVENDPRLLDFHSQICALDSLNDNGFTFDDIADMIEEQL